MPRKYPETFRARAVRMVRDCIEQEEGVSQYRAVRDIAPKLGVSWRTLQRGSSRLTSMPVSSQG